MPKPTEIAPNIEVMNHFCEKIAIEVLCLDGLETRGLDRLDFAEHSVWQIKEALAEAFRTGECLAAEAAQAEIAELKAKIAVLKKQAVSDSWTINPERMGR